jgi:hypothetical protein
MTRVAVSCRMHRGQLAVEKRHAQAAAGRRIRSKGSVAAQRSCQGSCTQAQAVGMLRVDSENAFQPRSPPLLIVPCELPVRIHCGGLVPCMYDAVGGARAPGKACAWA